MDVQYNRSLVERNFIGTVSDQTDFNAGESDLTDFNAGVSDLTDCNAADMYFMTRCQT
jgi:hypothetical protein